MRKKYPIDGTFQEYRKHRQREDARADWEARKDAKKDALFIPCPSCGKGKGWPCKEAGGEWIVCDARFDRALSWYRR